MVGEGLASVGTVEQFSFTNLKSSTAMSPAKLEPLIPSIMI